jgi:hypothetical protein
MRRRRVAIRRRPFPAEWCAIIKRNVPYIPCLPFEDREEFARHIQVFLAEKRFEGCGGHGGTIQNTSCSAKVSKTSANRDIARQTGCLCRRCSCKSFNVLQSERFDAPF